jgi:hypothetical protein
VSLQEQILVAFTIWGFMMLFVLEIYYGGRD